MKRTRGRIGDVIVSASAAMLLAVSVSVGDPFRSSVAHAFPGPSPPAPLAPAGSALEDERGEGNESTLSFPRIVPLQHRAVTGGESALSWYDSVAKSSADPEWQKGGRLHLDMSAVPAPVRERPGQFRLGTEYAFIDLSFRSVGTPGLGTGREGPTPGDVRREPATFSLKWAPFHDALKGQELLPTITASLGTNVTFAQPTWPRLSLSASRTNRETVGDPFGIGDRVGIVRVDSAMNTFSGELAHTWRFLTLNVGATNAQTQVNAGGSQEMNLLAYNAGLSVKLLGGRLILSPTLSWMDDRAIALPNSSTLTRTIQGALMATGVLIPDELTFSSRIFLTHTHTTDGDAGQREVAADAVTRLTWQVEKSLGTRGQQALSFQIGWNRVRDFVTPTNIQNNFGVFLVLDVSAPFLF